MIEIIRTNDAVIISVIEVLLKEAGIYYMVTDTHMSVLEGSLGFLQKRILVESDQVQEARKLIIDADLGNELRN
ncbi:putative signal transducing protein [Bartonella sp. HY761]|uniref:putative signal transducing protein n=1 Tax=Bartonella sp. HY761 TaxID=2979330 RepID=UPI0021FFEEDB|nr:DUF2007 domain-containing protein [Bartonella sp. HY761]UXN07103.1 DUF2007 domain-containing protein [Bartonella sp. HY761]